jgi:transcriptional regulator with XRE-family HTH domain
LPHVTIKVRRDIGQRLRQAREGAGLTQDQAAQELFRSRKSLASWEAGKTLPTLLELRGLAIFYGVKTDRLLLGVDDAEQACRDVLARFALT